MRRFYPDHVDQQRHRENRTAAPDHAQNETDQGAGEDCQNIGSADFHPATLSNKPAQSLTCVNPGMNRMSTGMVRGMSPSSCSASSTLPSFAREIIPVVSKKCPR